MEIKSWMIAVTAFLLLISLSGPIDYVSSAFTSTFSFAAMILFPIVSILLLYNTRTMMFGAAFFILGGILYTVYSWVGTVSGETLSEYIPGIILLIPGIYYFWKKK